MLRPGLIQPLHGIVSKTKLYRAVYAVIGVLFPVLKALFPKSLLTTEDLGRAMLEIAKHGAPKPVLEASDINALVPAKSATSWVSAPRAFCKPEQNANSVALPGRCRQHLGMSNRLSQDTEDAAKVLAAFRDKYHPHETLHEKLSAAEDLRAKLVNVTSGVRQWSIKSAGDDTLVSLNGAGVVHVHTNPQTGQIQLSRGRQNLGVTAARVRRVQSRMDWQRGRPGHRVAAPRAPAAQGRVGRLGRAHRALAV